MKNENKTERQTQRQRELERSSGCNELQKKKGKKESWREENQDR